ncbi:hypothetical protein [Virgibacillus necropolis]|uniref:DUF1570 domain-containing protein n=1 Tax=Virgibacillus necropolis TaxID=163877 RepID=A0A221MDE6_9BACI|nr:hypothetical protein [Virgibacillus necropolis]ASN05630.1 hypothetical protein CFK40_11720 [Virgibacillus necropolis]
MKKAYSVTNLESIENVARDGNKIFPFLLKYKDNLRKYGEVNGPKGIVFHDFESATSVYSETPLPAYTSRDLIHLCPSIEIWKQIYLDAIRESNNEMAKTYFNELQLSDVATIAAHEWTHHLNILGDFEGSDAENMWFEEGLCFYLPRKVLMSNKEFIRITKVEEKLIEEFQKTFGTYTINFFGQSDEGGFTGALYDYWRATWLVTYLTETYLEGNIDGLLDLFEKWKGSGERLIQDFIVSELRIPHGQAKIIWLRKT